MMRCWCQAVGSTLPAPDFNRLEIPSFAWRTLSHPSPDPSIASKRPSIAASVIRRKHLYCMTRI
jgi:hypothetical protein